MKINILGTEYEVIKDVKRDSDETLKAGADGYVDHHDKKIVLAEIEDDPDMTDNIDGYKQHVFRHEIIHAFFFEAGLTDWANDERITEYLSVQIPKMSKLFKEMGI